MGILPLSPFRAKIGDRKLQLIGMQLHYRLRDYSGTEQNDKWTNRQSSFYDVVFLD